MAREFPADPGPPGAWSDRVAKRERLLKVRVTQAGLDRLDAKARKLDMTRSAAIRAALRDWTQKP